MPLALAAVFPTLISAAAGVGAPIIKSILKEHVGGVAGSLAGAVVDQIAAKAGVEPASLQDLDEETLGTAINEVEAQAPQIIALYQSGLEGQFALLQAETAKGGLTSAWRWGWMYLLGFFWVCAFLLFPLARSCGLQIEQIDKAMLLTLTGWFIGLYMGGHTIKELGKQALDAARAWRAK